MKKTFPDGTALEGDPEEILSYEIELSRRLDEVRKLAFDVALPLAREKAS